MKTMIRNNLFINVSRVACFLLLLLPLFTWGKKIDVIVPYFEMKGEWSEEDVKAVLDSLDSMLPGMIVKLIDRAPDYEINAKAVSVSYPDYFGAPEDTGFIIMGEVWVDKPKVYVAADIIDMRNNRPRFSVGASVVRVKNMRLTEVADSLASILSKKIVIGLTKPVRIAISEFTMAGCAPVYESLKKALPAMLETGLSVSSDVVLVEVYEDTLFNIIMEGYRSGYKYDPFTRLKYGEIMLPNYLIRGTFWEHGGKVRIDVKCVNIETGEAIFGKGTDLPIIDVESIQTEMEEFSSEIRIGIIRDLNKIETGKTLSVVGLTPLPNTRDNLRQTKDIVREITRKLKTKYVKNIRIKENRVLIDSFMKIPTDRWKMASALHVNRLLVIRYENYGDGTIVIEAEIFDSENPDSSMHMPATRCLYRHISKRTGEIADLAAISLGVSDTLSDTHSKTRVNVKKELRPSSFGIRYGMVITSVNGPLENYTNQSFDLYLSIPLPFSSGEHWKIGGLVTWDWGNRTWENVFSGKAETSIHLLSAFFTLKYHFLPGESTNPYVGLGIGVIELRRIRHKDDNLLDAPGYAKFGMTGIVVGLELFANRSLHWTAQAKIWRALGEVAPETVNGTTFTGGELFGIDMSVGIGFKW